MASFRQLPYNYCSLALTPFKAPVCTLEGLIFDRENILKYFKNLEEHQLPLKNPVTGSGLALTDLIPLHFESTGAHDEYRCPITKKIFNQSSHIVAIRPSGNVYSYEAIEKLCLAPKNYFDLINPDIAFNKALVEKGGDLITLQDPSKLHTRNMNTFAHLKEPVNAASTSASNRTAKPAGPASSGIMKRVMSDLKLKESQIAEKSKRLGLTSQDAAYIYHNKIIDHPSANLPAAGPTALSSHGSSDNSAQASILYNGKTAISSNISEGKVAASFTCSSFSPVTKNQQHKESALLLSIKKTKENAYISLNTSFGSLNFELCTKYAPRAVYNFLQLAKAGAYDNTIFHRNIPGFMVNILISYLNTNIYVNFIRSRAVTRQVLAAAVNPYFLKIIFLMKYSRPTYYHMTREAF